MMMRNTDAGLPSRSLAQYLGNSVAGLVLLVGLGLAVSPAMAEPRAIPLAYQYQKDGNETTIRRITIWVSANDGKPREMVFDTGSENINMQIGSDANGVTAAPGKEPFAYLYGNGTYGYLLQQVELQDIQYHADENSPGYSLPIAGQSTYHVAKIVDIIGADDAKPKNPSAESVYTVKNEGRPDTVFYADLDARELIEQNKAADEDGKVWGTFGAGDFLAKDWVQTSGLIGGATKTGYVVVANGTSEAGKQDVTPGCSPCLIVDLDAAVRAQFTSVMPWQEKSKEDAEISEESFPGSGANTSTQFEGKYTLTFGDEGEITQISNVATLLDTGTPGGGSLTISKENLAALEAAGVEIKTDKDGNKTITSLNLVAEDGDGQPGAPAALGGIDVTVIEDNPHAATQFIAGIDFFLNQSVMYDLEKESTAYTSYFVSADNFTTDAPKDGEIHLSEVTSEIGNSFKQQAEDKHEYTTGLFGAAGVISGSGDLTIGENANLYLSNVNTYTGETVIQKGGALEMGGMGSIENSSRVVVDGTMDLNNKGNRIKFWGVSDAYNDMKIRSLAGSGIVGLYDRDLILTAADDVFSGVITDIDGNKVHSKGGLSVQGGVQTLAGKNTYTGATTVAAGAGLALSSTGGLISDVLVSGGFVNNGVVEGATTVQKGGMTGGTGSFGDLTVANGGAVAVGSAPMTVNNDFTQKAGSTLVFAPVADGEQPGVVVLGEAVIENGASITLDRATTGRLDADRKYALLSATGGINGNYDTLTGDLVTDAPFLSIALDKTATDLALRVDRSDIAFADMAITANQAATADGVESLSIGNPVFDEVMYMTSAQAAALPSAFDSLSGEIHPAMQGALIEESHFLRDAVNGRLRAAFGTVGASEGGVQALTGYGPVSAEATIDRPVYWGHAFGARGEADGDGNAARRDSRTSGMVLGYDAPLDDWRLGGVLALSDSSYGLDGHASSGSGRGVHLGAYAGTQWGQTALRTGLVYSHHRLKADRSTYIGTISEGLSSAYHGHIWQAFAEVGHRVEHGAVALEPYAGVAHVRLRTHGFAESGGETALTAAEGSMSSTFATIGVRAASKVKAATHDVTVSGGIGWRHAFGDVHPKMEMAFAGGAGFNVTAAPIARNAAVLDLGVDVDLGNKATLRLDYQGQMASDAREHRLVTSVSMHF
ncbi:autotransporter domain-containing protein [Paracoccus denitrificans]|uniref:autotransporter outer membrane beta-barrel domain-containing protein n=1 Tax=Paracoccus denitrificans TaxID=266 RepID=UPI001E54775D|nr:autotransporter domain-containing protein [Paracoccus denitrificans]UFS67182.1 autotransporter domain-containing protein [Paracoccus denitrificans]